MTNLVCPEKETDLIILYLIRHEMQKNYMLLNAKRKFELFDDNHKEVTAFILRIELLRVPAKNDGHACRPRLNSDRPQFVIFSAPINDMQTSTMNFIS